MITTKSLSALAAALVFAFAADARAGIQFVPLAGPPADVLHDLTGTSSTVTLPTVNWTIGTAAPPNFSRQLKNDQALLIAFTSTETPTNTFWLNQVPVNGNTPASGTTNVNFTFVPAFLPSVPGLYNLKYTYTVTTAAATQPKTAILEFNLNVVSPAPKLSIAGPLSVETLHTLGDPLPANQQWAVTNSGGIATNVNWAVTESPDAPWLTLAPASGTQTTGPATNCVGTLDLTGLTAGAYTTTLQFRNTDLPNDAAQSFNIPYTVILSNPKFVPGQRLIGTIPTVDKIRTIDVDVLAGMKMTFKVKTTLGTLKPRITILDSQGAELKTFAFKKSSKYLKKTFSFPVTGTNTIRFAGDGVTTGDFEVLTSRKLPKLALPRSVKNLTASEDYIIVEVPTLALKGALMNVNVVGLTFDANTLTRTFLNPAGLNFNVGAYTQALGNSTYYVQMPLNQTGAYTLRLSGFNTKNMAGLKPNPLEKVTVTISPFQPPEGDGTVDLDAVSP